MPSVPYSRYLIGPVSWYSFLIMTGALIAVILACREERRAGFPKDTVIDLALIVIPCGIIGARIYYVVFSWDQFKDNLISVIRIWEGGLAIYGGIIAGLGVLLLFCRKRRLPPLGICDLIVPGLALAQSIGRWGNWFNIEAYGLSVTRPDLCFFPLALQVPADGYNWHLATFFYESLWDMLIFVFLIFARHGLLRRRGDVFFFYVFLYAAGRLVIEELRTDSLYASDSIRISQLLSICLCLYVFLRYCLIIRKTSGGIRPVSYLFVFTSLFFSVFALMYAFGFYFSFLHFSAGNILFLLFYAFLMIINLFFLYFSHNSREVQNAGNEI